MSEIIEKYLEKYPEQIVAAKELAEKISKILDNKKAAQIKIIETNKQTIIADYFVIATGTSSTHIKSLAGEVEFKLKEDIEVSPSRTNGLDGKDWIILDYDCVLVHIFNQEAREYYKLEKLWGDGENINANDVDLIENLTKN